jgi:argininosuccinate lyase
MQEDKEAVFDSLDTVKHCLSIFTPMIATMTVYEKNMYSAAQKGFINATDLADYLTKRGMPFRAAYKTVGQIVAYAIANGKVLEEIELEAYKKFNPLFDADLYEEISLKNCVNKRISAGGTGPASIEQQIQAVREFLKREKDIH